MRRIEDEDTTNPMIVNPITVFVSPAGDDRWPGTVEKPLATLTAARDRLRALRGSSVERPPTVPVVVTLRAGTYALSETFQLESDDGGAELARVTWRAFPGEEVRLSGGSALAPQAWERVTNAAILARVDPAAHGKLLQYDVRRHGLGDTGPVQSRGFGFRPYRLPSEMELFFNDQPMPLPRWPRQGFMRTGPVVDAGSRHGAADARGAVFACLDERLKRWGQARDALCQGYWFADWAPSTQAVAAFDTDNRQIAFAGTSTYGVKEGRRFFVFNLLEELANPGEWYADRQTGILYFWPPDGIDGARIVLSCTEEPLVTLTGVSHVSLEGLIFEAGRGSGAVIDGGTGNRLSGCTFRNLGAEGACIGGVRNGAENCHVYQTGQGGLYLEGGDRRTLTGGHNFIVNCHIHHFNRICQAYMPGIGLSGVAHRVAHNLVHDAPHCALSFFDYEKAFGNDHIIEYNEFCDVALEADDAAAIYFARNVSERGTVIRHNFFHHIGTPLNWGTCGVYPDDGGGAVEIRGNVFYRVGNRGQVGMGAVFVNGGKDVVIDNNHFIECPQAVGVLLWPQEEWDRFLSQTDPKFTWVPKLIYEDVDITRPPYTTRYPALAELASKPSRNTFRRNLVCRCGRLGMGLERQDMRDNWMTGEDPGFVDAARMEFGLRPDAAVFARIPGHQAIPFERIGLQGEIGGIRSTRSRVEVFWRGVPQLNIALQQKSAVARLTLRIVNGTEALAQGCLTLACCPPAAGVVGDPAVFYALERGMASEQLLEIEVVPPSSGDEVYVVAYDGDRGCAGFAQLEFQFHHTVPRLDASGTLACLKDMLACVPSVPLIRGGETVATMRMAVAGEYLAMQATVCDQRVTATSGTRRSDGDRWRQPLVGLLVDSMERDLIRQVVFFPDGSGTGDLWGYHDTQRVEAPNVCWQTTGQGAWGYELTALVPLSFFGLTRRTEQFRLQGMFCVKPSPDAEADLLPLAGSTVAYHDSSRFCIAAIQQERDL